MKNDSSMWAKQLSLSLALTLGFCGAASAQGMMEYAGVMGIPKPVPKGPGVSNSVNSLYGASGKGLTVAASAGNSSAQAASRSAKTKTPARPKGMVVSGDLPGGQAEAALAAVLEITKQADATYKSGLDLKQKGKIEEAEKQLRKSLAMRERYWADRDSKIPEINLMLGEINNTLHRDKQAITDLEAALAGFGKFYGPGSNHRLKTLLVLSDSQGKVGEKVKSYDSYSQAYRLAIRAKLNDFNPTVMRLTAVKMALGVDKYRDAVDMCELAVHPNEKPKLNQEQLLSMLNDYADALKGMNRNRDANEILAEAEKIRGGSAPVAPVSTPAVEAPIAAPPVTPIK
jgi:tetratricopeptide (TPR) repeat protein